jgi:hypothetical protein
VAVLRGCATSLFVLQSAAPNRMRLESSPVERCSYAVSDGHLGQLDGWCSLVITCGLRALHTAAELESRFKACTRRADPDSLAAVGHCKQIKQISTLQVRFGEAPAVGKTMLPTNVHQVGRPGSHLFSLLKAG